MAEKCSSLRRKKEAVSIWRQPSMLFVNNNLDNLIYSFTIFLIYIAVAFEILTM
jgi:hypothetical protein